MPLDPLLEEPPAPAPAPPDPERARPAIWRGRLFVATVALLGLVAGLLVIQNAAPVPTGPARVSAWPQAPAASLAALAQDNPWPGTLPAPTPTAPTTALRTAAGPTAAGPTAAGPTAAGPTAAGPTAAGPTAAGAGAPPAGGGSTAAQSGSAFCQQARHGAAALGSSGLALLTSAVTGGANGPAQARSLVQQSVTEAARLRDTAPGGVSDAASTLATSWSRLAAALDSAGYGRVTVIALAVRYLAGPAVAVAVDALGQWATANCAPAAG